MKIVVLEGSPNQNGSSNLLAEHFIRGAKEAGHSVQVMDAAHANIHPCTGCIHRGYEGPCSQKDDMDGFQQKILAADMMVFVTPLYYYGMSAQLKTLIDRFCAFNSSIQRKHMKFALISVAWNSDNWTFDFRAKLFNVCEVIEKLMVQKSFPFSSSKELSDFHFQFLST